VLGRQVAGIDVLFAEVGPTGSLRELVLVEDKLLRNPEAKRAVLAQILDYAHRVQYELSVDDPAGEVLDDAGVAENQDEIESSLRAGECLLLICGDEVHPRMARLAERFAKDANPLSRYTLAVVAINLCSDGERYLLVPALAQSVVDTQRALTIRVTVVDKTGRAVPTEQAVAQDEAKDGSTVEEDFFAANWTKMPRARIDACHEVFRTLEAAGYSGTRSFAAPRPLG